MYMNAPIFEEASDIDYLITNVKGEKVTEQWIVDTYNEFYKFNCKVVSDVSIPFKRYQIQR